MTYLPASSLCAVKVGRAVKALRFELRRRLGPRVLEGLTMAYGKFARDVDAWAEKAKRRMEFVFRQSVFDVIEFMQTPVATGGNMPVATGFLRSSLRVTLNSPATGQIRNVGATVLTPADYSLTLAGAKITDTIYAVYLANYAAYQEYGSQGREPRRFVGNAIMHWPSIVRANAAKARSSK